MSQGAPQQPQSGQPFGVPSFQGPPSQSPYGQPNYQLPPVSPNPSYVPPSSQQQQPQMHHSPDASMALGQQSVGPNSFLRPPAQGGMAPSGPPSMGHTLTVPPHGRQHHPQQQYLHHVPLLGKGNGKGSQYGSMQPQCQSVVLGTQTQGLSTEEISKVKRFENIGVTGECCSQAVNDFTQFHRHLQRSVEEEELKREIASPAEHRCVSKTYGPTSHLIINIMVWRRSIIKVLLVLTLITCIDEFYDAFFETRNALEDWNQPALNANITHWTKNREMQGLSTGFSDYSLDVMNEIRRLRTGEAYLAMAAGRCVLAVFECIVFVMILRAAFAWVQFRRSRRLIIMAWTLSVVAPFCISLMPARLFVNTGSDHALIREYHSALADLLGIEERTNQLEDMCEFIENEGNTHIKKAQDMILQICGYIDYLPKGKISLPTTWKIWAWQKVDLDPAHNACGQARTMILEAKPYEALEEAQAMCKTMIPEIRKYQDSSGNMPQVVDWISEKVTTAVQLSISTAFAFRNFFLLFPVGLSIAPGLLQGALRMKVLMPQSAIPGMFVLILPWLQCPLAWSIYSFCFQLIGYADLFVGLVVISFTSIIYVVIGKMYNLTMPMTDEAVHRVIGKARCAVTVTSLIGYTALIVFVCRLVKAYTDSHFDEDWNEKTDFGTTLENKALYSVLDVQKRDKYWFFQFFATTVIHSVFHIAQAYILTSTAGVDWMIGEMVEFRLVELAMQMAEKHKDKQQIMGCNPHTGEVLGLAADQRERINALVAVHEGIVSSHFHGAGQDLTTDEVKALVSGLAVVNGAVVKLPKDDPRAQYV